MVFPPKEKIEITPEEVAKEIGFDVRMGFKHLVSEKTKEMIENRGGTTDIDNYILYNEFVDDVIKEISKRWTFT